MSTSAKATTKKPRKPKTVNVDDFKVVMTFSLPPYTHGATMKIEVDGKVSEPIEISNGLEFVLNLGHKEPKKISDAKPQGLDNFA